VTRKIKGVTKGPLAFNNLGDNNKELEEGVSVGGRGPSWGDRECPSPVVVA